MTARPIGGQYTMTSTRQSIVVSAPPQAILDVLLAVEAWPDWQREVQRVDVLSRDDSGRPHLTTVSIGALGFGGSYTVRYAYPREGVVEYHLVEGDMMTRHDARFVVSARGTGRTEFSVEMNLALSWRVPGPLVDRMTRKGVRDMLHRVKARAEAATVGE